MAENMDTLQGQEAAGSRLKEKVQQVRARAGEEWSNVRDRVSVYSEGADEFIDSVGRYVKENPQRSVMIAGAVGVSVGVLIGLLLRSRR